MTYEEFWKIACAACPKVHDEAGVYVTVKAADLKEAWEAMRPMSEIALVKAGDTGNEGLIEPLDMKFVSKRWGWESWICNNDLYCGKKLFIKQGHWLSHHYHNIKDEVLYVESGKVWFTVDGSATKSPLSFEMPAGYAYHVKPGTLHQIQAIEDTYIIEFSTKHMDEDSIRATTDLVINHDPDGK